MLPVVDVLVGSVDAVVHFTADPHDHNSSRCHHISTAEMYDELALDDSVSFGTATGRHGPRRASFQHTPSVKSNVRYKA